MLAHPIGLVTGLESCHALLSYEGLARELVGALKYRNNRSGLSALATAMALLVDSDDPATTDSLMVTWAPTSPARRRRRGYDQAELLARGVAHRLGRPCRSMLRRQPGPAQTGRTRADRVTGVAFGPRRRPILAGPVSPGPILVVDDVLTTGATLAAAAETLRAGGAGHVVGLVLAATPARSHSR